MMNFYDKKQDMSAPPVVRNEKENRTGDVKDMLLEEMFNSITNKNIERFKYAMKEYLEICSMEME